MKKITLTTVATIVFSLASTNAFATGTKTGGPSSASFTGVGNNAVVFTGTKTGGPSFANSRNGFTLRTGTKTGGPNFANRYSLNTGTKTGGPDAENRYTLSTGTKTGGPGSAEDSLNTGTKTGKPQGLISQDSGTFSLSDIFSKYFSF